MSYKSLSIVILLGFLVLPLSVFGQSSASLQRGTTSDTVRDLQNILKSDPSIYPQGLVTGFFGPATESAVKKIQARYGLPQTGIIDNATLQVIFPSNVQLKVLSPNGGELWDKSVNHTILWQVTVGPIIVNNQELAPSVSSNPNSVAARPSFAPFYDNVSIDLIKDSDSSFRYHIGTASLYQTQFNFKISDSVQNASDYRVKISVGGAVPCLETRPGMTVCAMYYPQYSFSDISDNVFSITGTGIGNDIKAKLGAMIEQLQQQINNLQNQLQAMRQLVNSL